MVDVLHVERPTIQLMQLVKIVAYCIDQRVDDDNAEQYQVGPHLDAPYHPLQESLELKALVLHPFLGDLLYGYDTAKVCRFLKEYPGESVDIFYSDSLSDSPMAWFAKEAWLVKNEHERVPWPEH
jgi:hypothetical protein